MALGKRLLSAVGFALALISVLSCVRHNSATTRNQANNPSSNAKLDQAPINRVPVIHVFVALADNVNQGIVPVSAALGNGDNPKTNLYWGAAFGVKTFFSRSRDWQLVSASPNLSDQILERCIFKHRSNDVYLVADAYRGKAIAQATTNFLDAASGAPGEKLSVNNKEFHTHGSADLIAYVGHDGLMDFTLPTSPRGRDTRKRQAIILACASKQYFSPVLQPTGAEPLLWTTNLMAPEAYVLSAAIDGWIAKENGEQVRARAARAYDKYQHCGLRAAMRLFATGW